MCLGFQFVPWKKLYNKVKQNENASIERINRLMAENGMHNKETFLINLVRYRNLDYFICSN